MSGMLPTKRALFPPNTPSKRQRMMWSNRRSPHKPETKFGIFTINHSAVAASTTLPTAIQNGNGNGERIGSKIRVLNLEIFAVGTTLPYRVIVYTPKVATNTITLGTNTAPVDVRNFNVLFDTYVDTSDNTYLRKRVMLKYGQKVLYNGTATTAYIENPIKMLIQTAGPDTVTGFVRTWYTDM